MPRPLKVYRAHIGFFDTVVAAHSQKEALAHWGGSAAEFRQGFATVTNDVKAVEAALKYPGVVLYRPFGSGDAFSRERILPKTAPQPQKKVDIPKPANHVSASDRKAEAKRAAREKAAREKAEASYAREEKKRQARERQEALREAKRKLERALGEIDQEERALGTRRKEAHAEYKETLATLGRERR